MTGGGFLLVAVAALVCGAVNSVAGGGSLVLFPALVAAGLPPLSANVTNSVITWPGYLGGVAGYRDDIRPQHRRLGPLLVSTVAGSTVGCVLLLSTPTRAFDAIVPWLVLAASALIGLQPRIRRRFGAPDDDRRRRAWRLGGVFVASIYGGYFGASLGVILVAVLLLTFHDTLHRLTALRNALSLADATVSLVVFGLFGPVRWAVVAIAAPCTLVGGFAGARLLKHVPEPALRWGIVGFGSVAAVLLLLR